MESRKCSTCKIQKPFSEFNKNRLENMVLNIIVKYVLMNEEKNGKIIIKNTEKVINDLKKKLEEKMTSTLD